MNNKNDSYGTVDGIKKSAFLIFDLRFLIGEIAKRGASIVRTPSRLQVGDTVPTGRDKSALPGKAAWSFCAVAVLLAGCVATPETSIRGTLNGSPFEVKAPKDGEMTGFDLVAETNGAVRLHIEHLMVKMNPDVIGQSGAAQRGIIEATGAVASNITAAAVGAAIRGAN